MAILTTAPTDSLALFNIASLTDETILVNTMMQHSFYLPVDILRHHAWKVHPILVLSAEKFSEFLEYISDRLRKSKLRLKLLDRTQLLRRKQKFIWY
jgi:hypothetical protein